MRHWQGRLVARLRRQLPAWLAAGRLVRLPGAGGLGCRQLVHWQPAGPLPAAPPAGSGWRHDGKRWHCRCGRLWLCLSRNRRWLHLRIARHGAGSGRA